MSADAIARLNITLDDVKPAVLRRVEVPFNIRLDRLHLAIQAAMGWTNTHLYEIRARDVDGRPDRSMPARPISVTCWRMLAPRRFGTSTILVTAGNTQSKSNASSILNLVHFIRA